MIPKRSPYGLIQEDLYPNDFLILSVCILLNCTTRKQVEKIMPEFISRYSEPQALLDDTIDNISSLIAPLGFKNRRPERLRKLADDFINLNWKDPRELSGIGEYGARSWEIFCAGRLGKTKPKDGALGRYWEWRMKNVK